MKTISMIWMVCIISLMAGVDPTNGFIETIARVILKRLEQAVKETVIPCHECIWNSSNAFTKCDAVPPSRNSSNFTETTITPLAEKGSSAMEREMDISNLPSAQKTSGLCIRAKPIVGGFTPTPGVCFTRFSANGTIQESGCTDELKPSGCQVMENGNKLCHCDSTITDVAGIVDNPRRIYDQICNINTNPDLYVSRTTRSIYANLDFIKIGLLSGVYIVTL